MKTSHPAVLKWEDSAPDAAEADISQRGAILRTQPKL